ncbi:MAG: ABC transporter ATP-binding protein [Clostridia bacterium]
MIEVKNLTKRFGKKVAVDNLSFTVQDGEILGFLGPNGAGKSTTMNIITGYLSATDGSASVNGHDILDEPYAAKKSVGYLPEQPPLYLDMTVDEYLEFVYELKKVRLNKKYHLNEIKSVVKISDVAGRRIKNLSKGYRQRVGLAQALIGNPAVLVLDEPTVGLDPMQIIEIREVIKELAQRHTIILSSHILPEVSAVCHRVLIINNGRIAAEDTPENLSRMLGGQSSVSAVIDGDEEAVINAANGIEGVRTIECTGRRSDGSGEYLIQAEGDVRRELSMAVSSAGCTIIEMKSNELSLEDIFIKLTGGNSGEKEEKANESDIQA